ncbi:hypothetical protein [Dyella monticola]|nr:hypothetical protein [Dyella monticola]
MEISIIVAEAPKLYAKNPVSNIHGETGLKWCGIKARCSRARMMVPEQA